MPPVISMRSVATMSIRKRFILSLFPIELIHTESILEKTQKNRTKEETVSIEKTPSARDDVITSEILKEGVFLQYEEISLSFCVEFKIRPTAVQDNNCDR